MGLFFYLKWYQYVRQECITFRFALSDTEVHLAVRLSTICEDVLAETLYYCKRQAVHQKVGRCRTEVSIMTTNVKGCFETQRRRHQKSQIGISLVDRK